MVIRNNIPALIAHRNFGINQKKMNQALRRLSSGYRINSAADDPAGLAVSEKMRAQISGLKMASRNAQNAISMLQTAEGGLNEVHDILQRMRELAVQSANGTYSEQDRLNLEKEYRALMDEIDRISSYTNFNGIKLLDGSSGGVRGAGSSGLVGVDLISANGNYTGEAKFNLQANDDGTATITMRANGEVQTKTISAAGPVDFTLRDSTVLSLSIGDIGKVRTGVINGVKIDGANGADLDRMITATRDSQFRYQIGANGGADQQVGVRIEDMSTSALGSADALLRSTSIADQDSAGKAISVVDAAINRVSSERAGIGAQINRLEHTIRSLDTAAENLAAAESSIRDADMAEEMMNYVKYSILMQAAQAMMAQAMSMPNIILQMLGA